MKKVRKAIIPAAGLGTRFLPATKTVPKEMLTIVDAPIIFYVVEEAVQAGIEDIVLIQGRGKTAIEDFFDTSFELEDKLAKDGKTHLLERLIRIREMANIVSIRQKRPLGLGHAVLCGQSVIGNDPFAVLLGDEIMVSSPGELNTTALLAQRYMETQHSVVAVMEVPMNQVHKYGIADVEIPQDSGQSTMQLASQSSLFKVKGFIEKPSAQNTPSRWAIPGRYVLSGEIFSYLKQAQPSVHGEIQLTDSLDLMAKESDFFASTFNAERYDAGDKFGYLKANVELGLKNSELKGDFKKYILKLASRLQNEK